MPAAWSPLWFPGRRRVCLPGVCALSLFCLSNEDNIVNSILFKSHFQILDMSVQFCELTVMCGLTNRSEQGIYLQIDTISTVVCWFNIFFDIIWFLEPINITSEASSAVKGGRKCSKVKAWFDSVENLTLISFLPEKKERKKRCKSMKCLLIDGIH